MPKPHDSRRSQKRECEAHEADYSDNNDRAKRNHKQAKNVNFDKSQPRRHSKPETPRKRRDHSQRESESNKYNENRMTQQQYQHFQQMQYHYPTEQPYSSYYSQQSSNNYAEQPYSSYYSQQGSNNYAEQSYSSYYSQQGSNNYVEQSYSSYYPQQSWNNYNEDKSDRHQRNRGQYSSSGKAKQNADALEKSTRKTFEKTAQIEKIFETFKTLEPANIDRDRIGELAEKYSYHKNPQTVFNSTSEAKRVGAQFLNAAFNNQNIKDNILKNQRSRNRTAKNNNSNASAGAPGCISFSLIKINAEDGEKNICLISLSGNVENYSDTIKNILSDLVNLANKLNENAKKTDYHYYVITKTMDHYLLSLNKMVEEDYSTFCAEKNYFTYILKLFQMYGKKAIITGGINCVFYPFEFDSQPTLKTFETEYKKLAFVNSKHFIEPLQTDKSSKSYYVPLIKSCPNCQTITHAMTLCWDGAQKESFNNGEISEFSDASPIRKIIKKPASRYSTESQKSSSSSSSSTYYSEEKTESQNENLLARSEWDPEEIDCSYAAQSKEPKERALEIAIRMNIEAQIQQEENEKEMERERNITLKEERKETEQPNEKAKLHEEKITPRGKDETESKEVDKSASHSSGKKPPVGKDLLKTNFFHRKPALGLGAASSQASSHNNKSEKEAESGGQFTLS